MWGHLWTVFLLHIALNFKAHKSYWYYVTAWKIKTGLLRCFVVQSRSSMNYRWTEGFGHDTTTDNALSLPCTPLVEMSCIHSELREHDTKLRQHNCIACYCVFSLSLSVPLRGTERPLLSLYLVLWGSHCCGLYEECRKLASHVLSDQKSQRATCRHKYYVSPSALSGWNLKPSRLLWHGTATAEPRSGRGALMVVQRRHWWGVTGELSKHWAEGYMPGAWLCLCVCPRVCVCEAEDKRERERESYIVPHDWFVLGVYFLFKRNSCILKLASTVKVAM